MPPHDLNDAGSGWGGHGVSPRPSPVACPPPSPPACGRGVDFTSVEQQQSDSSSIMTSLSGEQRGPPKTMPAFHRLPLLALTLAPALSPPNHRTRNHHRHRTRPGRPAGDRALDVVTIDRNRITQNASQRLENVLADVAGLQQFRRSDSRSAHPTSQGITLRGLGGNASSRALLVLDGVPQADPFGGWVVFPPMRPDGWGASG